MSRAEPVFMRIALEKIIPGNNIRLEGDVASLAQSIAKHGMLQPITVVHHGDGKRVECLFGHRRLAAARVAGLKTVPCLVRPRDREEVRVLTQLAENRDRRDMTKLEEALVYEQLHRLGMSQREIAAATGVHESAVSQRLQLLAYPECVRQAVHRRTIGITDALAIPVELAQATDGRTLAAVCRRGGRHVRRWVTRQLADQDGAPKRRKVFTALNIDANLGDEVREAAAAAGITVTEWAHQAIRAHLERGGVS